ncbi:MAG: RND transporter [Gammaproteobacteria bacterium]|nr:RND transporter [Gammaproteobacteria bacterium]
MSYINRIPLTFFIAILFLGLAPFFPEPHVWQKLKMLMDGTLTRPLDIFDFLLHGLPWILMLLKLYLVLFTKPEDSNEEGSI